MGQKDETKPILSESQTLIDFLYIDNERVDSLISQLRQGTLRSVVKTMGTSEGSSASGGPGASLCEHPFYGMPRLFLSCGWAGCLTVLGNPLQLLNYQGFRPPWWGPLARFPILESPSWDAQGVSNALLTEPGGLPGLSDRTHAFYASSAAAQRSISVSRLSSSV